MPLNGFRIQILYFEKIDGLFIVFCHFSFVIQEKSENDAAMTGGAFDFTRATTSLTDNKSIASSKKVTLVRHGLSSWNEESRVQVSCFLLRKLLN